MTARLAAIPFPEPKPVFISEMSIRVIRMAAKTARGVFRALTQVFLTTAFAISAALKALITCLLLRTPFVLLSSQRAITYTVCQAENNRYFGAGAWSRKTLFTILRHGKKGQESITALKYWRQLIQNAPVGKLNIISSSNVSQLSCTGCRFLFCRLWAKRPTGGWDIFLMFWSDYSGRGAGASFP